MSGHFFIVELEGQQGGEQEQTLSKRSESSIHYSSSVYSALANTHYVPVILLGPGHK